MKVEPIFPRPSRGEKFKSTVNAVAGFRPDFTEAVELLDELEGSLFRRYDDWIYPEVTAAFKELREALNEADKTLGPSTED